MLTSQQIAALRADVLAAVDAETVAARTAGDTVTLAALYNRPSAPAVALWNHATNPAAIANAINWAQYTPADAVAADAVALAQQQLRLLAIQTKQMNLQTLLLSRTLDCTLANIRAALRDAVTAIPAGAGGGNVNPGGANGSTVLVACTRTATRAEALLAGADATTGATTAKLPGFIGDVLSDDMSTVLAG